MDTITVTISDTLVTLPVHIDFVDPVSGSLPVIVNGYSDAALSAVSVPQMAFLLIGLLVGSLVVGLLTMIFLRFRVG